MKPLNSAIEDILTEKESLNCGDVMILRKLIMTEIRKRIPGQIPELVDGNNKEYAEGYSDCRNQLTTALGGLG